MPEGDDDLSVSMGEEGIVSGGVFDHGTQEEDDELARRVDLVRKRRRWSVSIRCLSSWGVPQRLVGAK